MTTALTARVNAFTPPSESYIKTWTARQVLIAALKLIGRPDAAALLPTDRATMGTQTVLDNTFDPRNPVWETLCFSFAWELYGNYRYWAEITKELRNSNSKICQNIDTNLPAPNDIKVFYPRRIR